MNILPFQKILFFLLFFSTFRLNAQETLNILNFGAKNDGSLKCTQAIDKAITAAVKNGGGTVYFPAGTFLTGPIHLQSNITLLIDAGAVIRFSDDFDDYLPMVPSRWEGTDVTNFSPLFYAYKAENITITGRGKIDGQGKKWWDFHYELYKKPKEYRSKWQQEFDRLNKDILLPDEPEMIVRGFCRPPFIQPVYCKNILVEGITIVNSPFWTINPEFCDNVTVTGVTINNPVSPNTDGINPESCSNVHISNCHINVGDDCITIKSGKDKPGRTLNVPAMNYTITNCTMLAGHGGVVIGSEMSGGVKNIVISNCVFDGTDRGIRIKTSRGRGGVVEDIRVSNIIMKNIKKEAITLNMFYSDSKPESVSDRTPLFRNIHISHITGDAYQAATLIGIEEMPVQNVSFSDIRLRTTLGFSISRSENISLTNIEIENLKGASVFAEKSNMIELNGIKNIHPLQDSPVIEFSDIHNAWIHNCFQPVETALFMKASGSTSFNISLSNNNLHLCRQLILPASDVPQNQIHITE